MKETLVQAKLSEIIQLVNISRACDSSKTKEGEGIYISHSAAEAEPVGEALDHLSLQVKYILFDLEATRRENRYLRQMLDARANRKKDEDFDNGSKF